MLKTIRSILRYGGLDRETYNKYEAYILRQDMKNLRVYTAATAFGFFVFGAVSVFFTQMASVNTKIYIVTAVAMLVLFAMQDWILRLPCSHPLYEDALVYIFMMVLYVNSIVLTVQHPDMPAVTYIAVLLMVPLLFARRPIGTLILQAVCTAVFCICVRIYKEPEMAFTDTWNGITFFMVSVAVIMIVIPIRIKSLAQAQIIKELSEYDWLTGLKNRSTYESDCAELSGHAESIVVIYADANGLHELNNTKGHAAGDNMLRAVSGALRDTFGKQCTYRIGGDEFVVLCPGANPRQIKQQTITVGQTVQARGYSVSFGCAVSNSPTEGLDAVIKRAEAAMYMEKANYYRAEGENNGRISR